MRNIFGMKSKALFGLVAMSAMCATSAQAAVVRGIHVTKGHGWVRVSVDAPGGSFRVKELPLDRSSDYRSIAIDVPGSSIAGGLEPKTRVPINEGLISQVRVKQMNGTVRVLVDVIAFPRYRVAHEGSSLVLGLDVSHMRGWRPEHALRHLHAFKGKTIAKASCACCKSQAKKS
jgi:hypothetical protein